MRSKFDFGAAVGIGCLNLCSTLLTAFVVIALVLYENYVVEEL